MFQTFIPSTSLEEPPLFTVHLGRMVVVFQLLHGHVCEDLYAVYQYETLSLYHLRFFLS